MTSVNVTPRCRDQAEPEAGGRPGAAASESQVSRADERAIVRHLSPAIAWPTLALAVLLPTLFATLVVAALCRHLRPWAFTPGLVVISYAHYTLVHEAVHGNVVVRPRGLRWVNSLVGWTGSVGLGGSWPLLKRTHLLHHSHTNTRRDPDIYVKGTFAQLVVKWLKAIPAYFVPLSLIRYHDPERMQRIRKVLSDSEIRHASAVSLAQIGLLIVSAATGHISDYLWLWFVPTRLAFLMLHVLFQWLPHHPCDETGRHRVARISLWRGAAVVTLQQNLHLVHHLWPSVPFYNYARLFRALRPALEVEGARIEGFRPGSRFVASRAPAYPS